MNQSFYFAGVKIDNLSLRESVVYIKKLLNDQKNHYIVSPNAAHIVLFQRDEDFRKAYASASLVLPDGMPLIWISRFLKPRLKERITGPDLLFSLCAVSIRDRYTIFLLGAENKVIEKAKNALLSKFPGLHIAGIHNGYFNNDKKILEKINELQPDILFIGMGFAKQEKWISKNINQLKVKVAVPIGGVFDVIAGKFRPAPRLMQNYGFEWLWRLIQEPRRLWKRYLIGNTIFIWLVLKEVFQRRNERKE
jgi:N-acetylglucosaminyldiphosphoundecaprenol N-acetyl-beta-D-mannosaminyltransferase